MGETEEKFPAQWALDLLEPSRLDRSNHIVKYYLSPLFAISTVCAVILSNSLSKRPLTANKPYMALGVIIGSFGGYVAHWTADIKFARRDEMTRGYIMTYPERFPDPGTKKYGDLFQEWQPIR